MKPNDATLRQIEAADPTQNTWLSANAGSGKTRVLTDRVARLLLAGVSPQNILCLTYTKAAASEMQNRLFKRLGSWAMKPDAQLRAELADLGVTEVDDLARARRLFAGAIETPGGLKIQTIHSFCAAILRRFPLEAGVAPQFQEMDDRTAKILQSEVLDDMAAGPQRPLVEAVAAFFTDQDFANFTREVVSGREGFAEKVSADEVWQWFGLKPGFDESDLPEIAFDGTERDLISKAGPILAGLTVTMQTLASELADLNFDKPGTKDLLAAYATFLFRNKDVFRAEAKLSSVPTKKAQEALGPLLAPFQAFMQRVASAREAETRLHIARKTFALHRFAHPFVAEYEQRKHARGWLDFDDLITLAGRLLNDPGLAAWVLYRLDGGIDHILVDEAQDTSPAQWRVIESLAREFTTGESARSDRERTLFVVGDLKQSIYSFQGADPAEFTRMREEFGKAFRMVGQEVKPLQLEYSFRSSRAILDVVDFCLESAPGLGDVVKHIAFDNDKPGRVDLWPVVEREGNPAPHPWTDPVDMLAPEDTPVVLANRVADAIAEMLTAGSIPSKEGGMRAIRPGDILVLVRRRSDLFHEVIRACKARNLPIAGADRLRIEAELAVKDIGAVLAFLATPEDDLSLAAALRSPLFGLSEDTLFRLAHGRGGRYLWNVLREQAEAYPEALAILDDLRGEADFMRPYDLIDRILTRHDGRRRLIARLGPEAEDGIDALLAQALTYEKMEVPSLTGFLTWLAAGEVEMKRQTDDTSDQIRVMTVHGAKGLESPVVFLPETARHQPRAGRKTISAEGRSLWRTGRETAPEIIAAAIDAAKDRAWEENMRLLYVAMTRAESWLIVAGAGDVGKEDDGASWYRIIEAGLRKATAEPLVSAYGQGLRFQIGSWECARDGASQEVLAPVAVPAWAYTAPGVPAAPVGALVPSKLGGAKVLGVTDDDATALEAALRHGRQVHRLLEFLPSYDPLSWPDIAPGLLAFGEDAASGEEAAELLEEVRRVMEAPGLQFLFAAETLAEVEVSAPADIAGASRIHGIIDRLVIAPEHVLMVDFKTNREVPDRPEMIPEGILRQMGAYELALAQVYPDRRIETAILWTRTAELMPLPPGMALRAFGRLDVSGSPT